MSTVAIQVYTPTYLKARCLVNSIYYERYDPMVFWGAGKIVRHRGVFCTNNSARVGNDVINIITSEGMDNTPLESRM